MVRAVAAVLLALIVLTADAVRADDAGEPAKPAWGPRLHVLHGAHAAMRVDPERSRAEIERFPDVVRHARIDRVLGFTAEPTWAYVMAVGVEGTWTCHLDASGWTTAFTKGLHAIRIRNELDARTAHRNASLGSDRENRVLARDMDGRWWIGRGVPPSLVFYLPRTGVHLQTKLLPDPVLPPDGDDVGELVSVVTIGARRVRLFRTPKTPWDHWIVSDPEPGLEPPVGTRVVSPRFQPPEATDSLMLISVWPKGQDRTAFDALLMTRIPESTEAAPTPRTFHYTTDSGASWTSFSATGWKGHGVVAIQRPASVAAELAHHPN